MARRATILLVEDDVHDIELLRLGAAKANASFGLIEVQDGAEAIKYLSGEGKYSDRQQFPEPALVLLDLTMPGMSGFDVLRWANRQSPASMPPIIVFSYSRLEQDRRLALELGAKQYLVKPLDLDG